MQINIPDFKNLNAKEKLQRLKILFFSISKIVSTDTGILKPTYIMSVLGILWFTSIFGWFITFIESKSILWIMLIIIGLCVKIYEHFFFVKEKTLQSILIHQTITGESANIQKAKEKYKTIAGKMFFVWLADYFITKWANNTEKSSTLKKLIFSTLEEVWDLLKNFMIPVIAIEQKGIQESIDDLKSFKWRVPEFLLGVLWFDFIGGIIIAALWPIFLIILLISWLLAYGLPFMIEINTLSIWGINIAISAIIIWIYIMAILSNTVKIIADSVKTIYFTIFYMMIQHPDKIKKEMIPQIIEFIEMRDGKNEASNSNTTI